MFRQSTAHWGGGNLDDLMEGSLMVYSRDRLPICEVKPVVARRQHQLAVVMWIAVVLKSRYNLGSRGNQPQ